jgi:TPR repeat protein
VTTAEGVSGGFELEAQLLKDDAQTPVSDPISFRVRVAGPNERSDANISNTRPKPDDAALTIASAERAAQIAAVPEETAAIETDFLTQLLIRDGNKLMRDGDILGARKLYEQAAANGNPEAALAMGRSFDPSYFEKLPVKTGKPDPATAFQWYKKALDGGLVTARVKIDGLKQWLQR